MLVSILIFNRCFVCRYEKLLGSIEVKRESLNSVNNKLNQFCDERTNANEQMRELERSLVEVLVYQQKKLLEISSRVEPK